MRRNRDRNGHRSAGDLLTAFSSPQHPFPMLPTAPPAEDPDGRGVRDRVNRRVSGRRGAAETGRGWAPVEATARAPVYLAATNEIGGLFPLLAANGVPAVGARMGYDVLSGGAFYCHPIEWLLRGLATNPNMVIFGEPGRGKSSTVVAFVLRMMLFG
ncbi:MAG: ATP-binding protein, partial [Pseudonocardia sp.]|nr:ATP-binding protein [Pseudonocardia sp.]